MQATDRIQGYDGFEQIALGGMATVYKARKVSLDKVVAIKVLYPHLAQDRAYIERFKREAQTAARVQHDNIVNVIDYGESDDSHYIVMEYYDGVTLEDLLEQHRLLPLDVCFAVLLNICYGLEAAHAESLVHRDIKPANIIFTSSGGVKLADFGLARAIDSPKTVTQHGKVIGTPAYMSPEQTRGDDVGTQSDIFSLGVVGYELACGQRPFDGRNYAEVVSNIQSEQPQPVTDLNPLVGAAFADVIDRMLGKGLDQRYAHVSETIIDLEEAIDNARYKRDRRTLRRYIGSPTGYLESFNRKRLEKLRANPPSAEDGRDAAVLYYRRVLWLDPSDKRAKAELSKLNAKEPTSEREAEAPRSQPEPVEKSSVQWDPKADYKVYLESIDPNQETPATFALKLSMKIRSPLPRVMAIVKNMPAVVGGRLSLDKAKRLAKIIDGLGGVARIEIHPIDESTGSHRPPGKAAQPAAKQAPAAPSRTYESSLSTAEFESVQKKGAHASHPGLEKTVEHHPINERMDNGQAAPPGKPTATRECPRCGWDEDAEARFCSICLYNFNKTEPLSLADLQGRHQSKNPLLPESFNYEFRQSLADRLHDLPNTVKYGGLAALIILLLLIFFGR
jgi:serine/threonine protein kinase